MTLPLMDTDTVVLRSVLACVCSLLISMVLMPWWIRFLSAYHLGQPVSSYTPPAHQDKAGTPTMGGMVFVGATVLATLLFGHWHTPALYLLNLAMLSFAGLGAYDDWAKISVGNNRGLRAVLKYALQSLIAVMIVLVMLLAYHRYPGSMHLWIPFVGIYAVPVFFLCVLSYFVIVGSSNAVNLTDGLDGLAMTVSLLVILGLAGVGFWLTHPGVMLLPKLLVLYVPDRAEACVFLAALGGSGLGFLCFNTYPARIFMGDSGALALGGVLGTVSVLLRVELLFFLMAMIFVIEAVSVMLQLTALRLSHKRFRFFLMAPIHHHFELKGWHEHHVVVRFSVFTVLMLLLVGLACLSLSVQ